MTTPTPRPLTAVSRARAWHENAVKRAAADGDDPVSRWLRRGQPQDSETK